MPLLEKNYMISKDKVLYNLSLFRILYIISLMLEIVAYPPIELAAGYLNGVTFVWGIVICFHFLFHDPQKLNINHKKIAISFILVCLLTSFINFSTNILMNLISVFNNFMYLFLFLGMKKNTSKEDIDKEMNFILKFIVFFSSLISLIGIYISFRYKHIYFMGHNIGIFENRFFGISTNPNQLGFLSAISIFACDLLNDKYMKSKFKFNFLLSIIFILFNTCVLFLTDSNASFVFVTIYLAIRIFYENFSKYEKIKDINFIRELIYVVASMMLIVSGSFLTRISCQRFMNRVINHQKYNISDHSIKIEIKEGESHFGRGGHELSSGRISLFKQGMQLAKIRPLLGLGRENLSYYGEIYIKGGLLFSYKHFDLHNLYLTLLVSYGMIGFSLFICLIILILCNLFYTSYININNNNGKFISKLFAIIISYLSYVNFEVGGMSGIAISDVLLWVFIGYFMTFSDQII